MERRKTFGQEVKSQRKQQGWSQKDLADNVSDLSVRRLGKIERGQKPFVTHHIVTQLANAFGLEGLAREEFFGRAGLNEGDQTEEYLSPQDDAAEIDEFYRGIALPAYIHDAFLTLRSVNSSMMAFLGIHLEDYQQEIFAPSGPNALRNLFQIRFEAQTNWTKDKAWRQHTEMLVYRFRVLTRRYADSQRYLDLLDDLKKLHEFKE